MAADAPPAWTRVASMNFTQSRGGLSKSTLSLLNYNALSSKADMPLAVQCANSKAAGDAAKKLVHHPAAVAGKQHLVTEVCSKASLRHHLIDPAKPVPDPRQWMLQLQQLRQAKKG